MDDILDELKAWQQQLRLAPHRPARRNLKVGPYDKRNCAPSRRTKGATRNLQKLVELIPHMRPSATDRGEYAAGATATSVIRCWAAGNLD
jgi:hypothetical protein